MVCESSLIWSILVLSRCFITKLVVWWSINDFINYKTIVKLLICEKIQKREMSIVKIFSIIHRPIFASTRFWPAGPFSHDDFINSRNCNSSIGSIFQSVVLKLLFCGIIWGEIPSYRNIACNLVSQSLRRSLRQSLLWSLRLSLRWSLWQSLLWIYLLFSKMRPNFCSFVQSYIFKAEFSKSDFLLKKSSMSNSQISPFILTFTVWFLINKNLSFSFLQYEGWSDKHLFRRPCIEVKLYWGQLSKDLRVRPVTLLMTQVR